MDFGAPSTGTGPYRRIWFKPGFSWFQGTAYLPGRNTGEISYAPSANVNKMDSANIYSGGWGSDLTPLDVGFLHDQVSDQWSLFISAPGHGMTPETEHRLAAGQEATLAWYADPDGVIHAAASGTDATSGELIQYDFSLGPVKGWKGTSESLVLKQMVSIAQDPPENHHNGSFVKGAKWSNVTLGTQDRQTGDWQDAYKAGGSRYPEDNSVVQVDISGGVAETVSIVLPSS